MASLHLNYILRLPPGIRSLLRPSPSLPTLRNLSTHSAKARPTTNPPSTSQSQTQSNPDISLPPRPRFRAHFPRTAFWTLFSLLTWLPALAFFHNHIGRSMTVGGRSMYPFLNTDYATSLSQDRVWVDLREGGRKGGLKRGEIIVFWSPNNPAHMAVKRIIGLEGDIVVTRPPYPFAEERVPEGHVWVEGEHPEGARSSVDSNTYGPVAVALLVGKVKAVYWPWEKAGWVRWQDYKGNPRVTEGKVEEPIELYTF